MYFSPALIMAAGTVTPAKFSRPFRNLLKSCSQPLHLSPGPDSRVYIPEPVWGS